MATRRIEINDPDLLPTERIEPAELDLTIEEAADWLEETELELATDKQEIPLTALAPRARGVFERLRRAGVTSRRSSSTSPRGPNRRHDVESARRFDEALAKLAKGDLEAAFYEFTELLEERPHSTRIWIYVRAIQQAKTAGE